MNSFENRITIKELYPAIVQLIINLESVLWSRLSSLMLLNSLLIILWLEIINHSEYKLSTHVILIVFNIIGVLAGFAWAFLGYRGKKNLKEHIDNASILENDLKIWPQELGKIKPFTKVKSLRDNLPYKIFGSYYILIIVPLVFGVIHVVLIVLSFSGSEYGR